MAIENQKIGVSQKAIIFNNKGKILVIRRSASAPIYPLFWDLPGGVLEFGEDLEKAMKREIWEETKLRVKNLAIAGIGSWFDPKQNFWVTICYFAVTVGDKVKLSWEHNDFKWISPKEFLKIKSHIAVKNDLLVRAVKKFYKAY